ncbi:hypothetical protein BWK63_00725 [Flavobacterium covae]|uniref:Uncharacterized protein n=1 Tax=Flavobacterium covae TaxID=2906076 RepID=A0ABW8PFS2_9FLAO|nr:MULTISPECIES: hypothetical protein [Flavobacterium]OWP82374.1 hypothetical protein BWK63_00725 [Flavobacterium covae]OXA83360.1 hypothetical protein B0A56_01770 [Flavobacterium columnare NBRC 100251 = ATCC 23463]POR23217.1 hypothetical protein BWK57_03215 [Flavobacterium columnare]
MEQEKVNEIIISFQDLKQTGLYNPDGTSIGFGIRTQDYKEIPQWNEFDFRKEVFEKLLGEGFGKKDFYYEPNTWGFIVDEIENKIREVLTTIKKVPKEHQQNPLEYIRAYRKEHFDRDNDWNLKYEDVEEFLGEFYHHNIKKYRKDLKLYYFQLFYNNLKKNFEEGQALYISVATVEKQK